jgi:NAD-dependent DNA ligase
MEFNVNMRQRAVDLGLTMNEHCLYHFTNKIKGKKVDGKFKTEQDIFKFLGMVYTPPTERKGPIQLLKKEENTKKTKIKIKDSTIDLIEDFAICGISKLKQLSETTLANMIRIATYHYYHKKPIITDNTYDILLGYVERNYPDNPVLDETGSEIMDKVKVKLPYYMGSMDKIKPDTNAVSNWVVKYQGPYIISCKLDGISALYSTENGEKKLYTRGKATIGTDISYMIPHLALPDTPNITIRGELIIRKDKFNKKYSETYKCARNFVAGTINGKEMNPDKFQDIDFVAYEVIKPQIIPSKQMIWLQQNGVICVKNGSCFHFDNESLSTILVSWRDSYEYEIDGIIITDDKIYERQQKNPKHSVAFKMVLSDQIMESKVVDIHWNPSKYGYLKPRVQIEPITIKGATIEYVTGHNAEFIRKNCIGIGALVKIIRSGDVIPKIQEVIVKAEYPKMPDVEWEWNDTHIDAILKNSENNKTMIQKELESFALKLEIVNLGPGNIKKIVDAGFDSIQKLLKLKVEDLIEIPGFQTKSASKIINSIREQLSEMPLSTLITSINVFGRGMGEKRIKNILKAYPNIITSDESIETKFEKVKSLNGFAKKTAIAFVEKLPEIVEFLESTELLYKETNHNTNHPLYQKKIKFSGFRDKEMQKTLEEIGVEIQSAISSKTDFVIVEDIDDLSDKVRKAQEKNISVISKEQFEKIYI